MSLKCCGRSPDLSLRVDAAVLCSNNSASNWSTRKLPFQMRIDHFNPEENRDKKSRNNEHVSYDF